jgi:GNAT superfamily N-acetyltransferase
LNTWRVLPLTPERWTDLEALFGPRGACGGCWCMTPRLTRAEYERNKGEGNRRALRALVDSGTVPGLLGFVDDRPVAWCSLGPRGDFSWLARSRLFRPVDDRPVWSIVCLFIDKTHRRQGLSARMLEAACAHAAAHGATCVEAYPVEPRGSDMPAVFAHHGLASAYLRAGFHEVARPSPTRPIMRREV